MFVVRDWHSCSNRCGFTGVKVFLLFSFFLFGNFVPYLLLIEGMKNSVAVLGNSQDGGDPEQIGLEGRGKMGYFSRRKWLQQNI